MNAENGTCICTCTDGRAATELLRCICDCRWYDHVYQPLCDLADACMYPCIWGDCSIDSEIYGKENILMQVSFSNDIMMSGAKGTNLMPIEKQRKA